MAIPTYNAAPLSKTFLIIRILQLLCLGTIIGIIAKFLSDILSLSSTITTATSHISSTIAAETSAALRPPPQLLVTLTIASFAAFYTLLTIPFYWAQVTRGLLIIAGFDAALAAAFAVVGVVLGKPLGGLNCLAIKSAGDMGTASAMSLAEAVAREVVANGVLNAWVGESKAICVEMKAVWVIGVALCVLFLGSALLLPAMFARQKRAGRIAAKGGA